MAKIITWELMEKSLDYSELVEKIKEYYIKLKDGKVSVTHRIFSPTQDGGVYIIGLSLIHI